MGLEKEGRECVCKRNLVDRERESWISERESRKSAMNEKRERESGFGEKKEWEERVCERIER